MTQKSESSFDSDIDPEQFIKQNCRFADDSGDEIDLIEEGKDEDGMHEEHKNTQEEDLNSFESFHDE